MIFWPISLIFTPGRITLSSFGVSAPTISVPLTVPSLQDYDGWTPLHAAAHWAQREACELLADAYVNMDIKNCVGQTPFDVADPDVLRCEI